MLHYSHTLTGCQEGGVSRAVYIAVGFYLQIIKRVRCLKSPDLLTAKHTKVCAKDAKTNPAL